ncbi:MAG: LuxR C-terminal-related transcriptional regulator [Pseudomonadota bacterium]|nr:LuxR C-terminal-related transcriptional regulator [Pseudomonadota bacterium]
MLLKTKFYAPPIRAGAIPRQRLLQRLGQPAPGHMTLIHAPAGYGKTTLAKQWLDQLDCPHSWLSLDLQDNDPQRFWRYVGFALQRPLPPGDLTSAPEDHIVHLINHWQDQSASGQPLHVLVLDDFHCIQDEAVLAQVSWFLDRLPAGLHVVITARNQPSIHIPRRRVQQQLTEVKAQELCFQSTETRQFLENTLSLQLDTHSIDVLHNQTEGWAAALQLAGLSLKGGEQATEPLLERKHNQSMMDYLAEEVLAGQPEPIQQFLLHVTQLRRFSLPLCEQALAELPECPVKDSLEHLIKHNLFLIPLDATGTWFRFHDLFRENIQNLARQLIPESLTLFLRQAAQWYVQSGDEEEAIVCLLQAQLWAEAADLIETLGVSRMLAGKNESLNWWLNRLPVAVVTQRPKLALTKAWTLFCTERVLEAEPYLDQADRSLQGRDQEALRMQIFLFRAHIARFRGQHEEATRWSELAMEHSTDKHQQLNAVTLFAMGLEQFQSGQQQSARAYLEQSMEASFSEENYFCGLSVSVLLSHVYFQCGLTHKALATLDQVRHWIQTNGECEDQLDRWQNIMYFTIYRETRQLEQAQQAIEPLLQHQQEGAENGHSALINLMRAVLKATQGHWEEALALTRSAASQMAQDQSHWSAMSPNAGMIEASIMLQQGKLEEALAWCRHNEKRLRENRRYTNEEDRIVLARCLALDHQKDAALEELNLVLETATRHGRLINRVRALLTMAMVHCRYDEVDAAADALHCAIQSADSAGYYQMLFDGRGFLQPALQRLQARGHSGWWEKALLKQRDATLVTLPEQLTSRELEVLNLIAVGHRNQAIADTLHIALTTTKAHIRHIYEKMSVTSRTQAVARGRELGLIS